MFSTFLILLIAVLLQPHAAYDKDRYYMVDNDIYGNYFYPNIPTGAAITSFKLQDLLKLNPVKTEKVKIQLYYECHCPDCREFDSKQLKQTVLALGSYLDVNVYPYGNAQTEERDGRTEFTCQHGPAECYGNKLHACAIDYFGNITLAVLYNSCMMDASQAGKGSDDAAADVCARSMGFDYNPIKNCAKGPRGTALLKYYGVESKKENFKSVPHILINGVENSGDNFMRDVCNAFKNPPEACASAY